MNSLSTLFPIIESKNNFIRIAGPCSAENYEQVMDSAKGLAKSGKVDVFRCGVWKPRSSPDSFEGAGNEALKWLKEVENGLHLPVCTEIASPLQLENAVKEGLTIFWIGARTSINPFLVQSIADAAKGLNISVMIKNPLSPDLKLWYGNFERFAKAGIDKIAGIYRGFAGIYPQIYRNDPAWQMLIEFKRLYPQIPLIFDPSHIAGNTQFIPDLTQKALSLNADGWMLEVHCDPKNALSDKDQQLSPHQYIQLIENLIIPQKNQTQNSFLQEEREIINHIDYQIFKLLSQRFTSVAKIAKLKKEQNLPILQLQRWEEVYNQLITLSSDLQIDTEFAQKFLALLHEYAIKIQQEIIYRQNTE
ncbi:MAG: bifunctional 3-deoxy-7-phosphoheptulonate synthase/chorismate mutase type II [Bacteroidales bacterium]|jgi:chorismate mutase|nr:bifunctional 3-deoxy-7-phosphoheptulonate synthase/chorismate mutase type II [Bacteroidales bacterium]